MDARPRDYERLGLMAVIYAMLIGYAIIVVYPMFWMLCTSLKTDRDIFLRPFALPKPRISPLLRVSDIKDWEGFCSKFNSGERKEASSSPERRVRELLPPEGEAALRSAAQDKVLDESSKSILVNALNEVLKRRDLYSEGDFANVAVSKEAEELLAQDREALSDRNVRRLNRLLVEAIFPQAIAKIQRLGLQWSNFSYAWTKGHFGDYFLNSVVVTAATVAASTFFAAMAAYALARFTFRGARPLFFYFLAGLMVPLQMAIIPLFFQMNQMHLLSSRLGLISVYVAFGMPFAIFVLTGFFKSLPASLHESALIDGAGEFRAFWYIMLPLARPGLVTVAIFSFLGTWNEFFMAFMFLSGKDAERLRTLPLGLANITIVSQYRSDWGMAFAGLVIVMLPTLLAYTFLQRRLTKGITLGALKA